MKAKTKNLKKSKLVVLSKKLLLTFITFFLLTSCSNNEEVESSSFTPQNIPFTTIGSGPYSGNAVTSNLVIQNNTQWNNLMNQLTPDVTNQFTETNIDFNNFFLVAIIDGVKPNTGYSVIITNIVENENNIIVSINHNNSGSGFNVLTQPFHIIKIPIQTKPFVFQ
jgi:UDP-galactopyranose mutase